MLSIHELPGFSILLLGHLSTRSTPQYTGKIYYQDEVLREIRGNSLEKLVAVILNLLHEKPVGATGEIMNNFTQKVECSYQKSR